MGRRRAAVCVGLLLIPFMAVNADIAAVAACQTQYFTAVGSSPSNFPCPALATFGACIASAILDLSSATASPYVQLLQAEQQAHVSACPSLNLTAPPVVSTSNSSLFVQVAMSKDVVFNRLPFESVSIFDIASRCTSLELNSATKQNLTALRSSILSDTASNLTAASTALQQLSQSVAAGLSQTASQAQSTSSSAVAAVYTSLLQFYNRSQVDQLVTSSVISSAVAGNGSLSSAIASLASVSSLSAATASLLSSIASSATAVTATAQQTAQAAISTSIAGLNASLGAQLASSQTQQSLALQALSQTVGANAQNLSSTSSALSQLSLTVTAGLSLAAGQTQSSASAATASLQAFSQATAANLAVVSGQVTSSAIGLSSALSAVSSSLAANLTAQAAVLSAAIQTVSGQTTTSLSQLPVTYYNRTQVDQLLASNANVISALNSTVQNLLAQNAQLQATVRALNSSIVNISATVNTATVVYDSCAHILLVNPSSTSGVYSITPAGTGTAITAYCDMVTDGGGWTLAGSWMDMSGYTMNSYASAGRLPTELPNYARALRSAGTGPGQGPTHYSSAIFNALFYTSRRQDPTLSSYLTLCGTGPGGFILYKGTYPRTQATAGSFDAYRGTYDTYYSQLFAGMLGYSYFEYSTNANPLPRASAITWTLKTPQTPRGPLSSGYHYLPDDFTSSGQWLFRENLYNIPGTSYAGSSNVPSLLFIR